MKKELSEKEQLIKGWENRIKHQKAQLAKTRKFHREEEARIAKRVRQSEMQLRALKKN